MANLKAGDIVQCIDTKGLFALTMGGIYTVVPSTPLNSLIVYDDTGRSIVLVNDLGREMLYLKQFVVMSSVSGNPNSGVGGVQPTTFIYKPGDQVICVKTFPSYDFTVGNIYTIEGNSSNYYTMYIAGDTKSYLYCFLSDGQIDPFTSAYEMFQLYHSNSNGIQQQVNTSMPLGQIVYNPGQTPPNATRAIGKLQENSTYGFLGSGMINEEKKKYSFSVEQKDTGHNSSHEVIENWALNKSFLYCRQCRKEVTK